MKTAAAAVLLLGWSTSASATMIYAGPATDSGGGIGAITTLLTIQDNDGTEEGCVAWNGTADIVGTAACTAGGSTSLSPAIISGSTNQTQNEKTGNSQTQTTLISSTGIASASTLILLLNVNEPAGNPFTVENLSLSVFLANGTLVYNAGNLLNIPITLDSTSQGIGTLDGFAFRMDPLAQAAVQAYWNVSGARIGVSMKLNSTAGSVEVLRLLDSSRLIIEAPEPGSIVLAGLGLGAVMLASRKRANRISETAD